MSSGWLSEISALLRDQRLSIFIFLIVLIALFLPFESIGLTQPKIIQKYEDVIVVAGILAASNLTLFMLSWIWRIFAKTKAQKDRNADIKNVFNELNYEELCVLFFCVKAGIRVFKATPNSIIVMSLKAKGCIRNVSGIQSLQEMHFRVYDDIYDLVARNGESRFPTGFFEDPSWEDKIKDTFFDSTNWRQW